MVTLQKPAPRHEEQFLRAVRKSRALYKGFASPPASVASFQQYINSLRKENRVGFLLTLAESDDLVGVVNVNEIVRGSFQSAYLGYYAFLPYAGQGLMSQGMRHVIRRCFKDLKLHRLEANIQPENERSIALVKALGFSKEGYSPRYLKISGRWRDHERWAICSEEWR
ncbi:MAG: GNAT family N-acetyltransferase [Planctomycetota bacterium]